MHRSIRDALAVALPLLLVAAGAVGAPAPADAQQAREYQITGTVVDAQNLQPLSGVVVELVDTERGSSPARTAPSP